MKKTLLFVFLGVVVACSAPKKNTLIGTIEGLEAGDRIYLAVEDPDGSLMVAVDSVTVIKAGEFRITTTVTDNYVQITRLVEGETFNPMNNQYPRRFLEGYSTLNLAGSVDQWFYLQTTGGIYDHPELQPIIAEQQKALAIQRDGFSQIQRAHETGDTILRNAGRESFNSSNRLLRELQMKEFEFAENHPDFAYSAALYRYNDQDFDHYEKVYDGFSSRVQQSPAGEAMRRHIENTRATSVGAEAPDFSLTSLDGQTVTLSALRGNYVLVDFWGSWCGPCRMSSPALVALYEKLNAAEKNVTFIGIACHEKNDADWIGAIEADGLVWTQLNDSHSPAGKSIQKRYAVDGVPTCMLISPEGTIVFKDHPFAVIPEMEKLFNL